MRIDQTDLRILKELQGNAQISNSALAKRVSLTPTPCARRVQQLEAAGFIKGTLRCSIRRWSACPSMRSSRCGCAGGQGGDGRVRVGGPRYPEVIECWAMSGGDDYLFAS